MRVGSDADKKPWHFQTRPITAMPIQQRCSAHLLGPGLVVVDTHWRMNTGAAVAAGLEHRD